MERIKYNIRTRISHAIRHYSTTGKIMPLKKYGIDIKDIQAIIKELQPFPKDIKNYEIDHVVPLSYFDFNNMQEIKWAIAPENHQWLTIHENRKKHNSFIG